MIAEDLSNFGPMLVAVTEAELALAEGRYAVVEQITREWVERLRQVGIYYSQPDLLYLRGRAFLAQNDLPTAERVLKDAHATAEYLTARRLLWRIRAALADLEKQRGNDERAAQWRQRAVEVVNFITAHMPAHPLPRINANLREHWLALPAVQQLLRGEE